MKISEQIAKDWSINISSVIPYHLDRRLNKKARDLGITKSKFIRIILADSFGYKCKQFQSRGKKIYLYRREKNS